MENQNDKLLNFLIWLMPSGIEVVLTVTFSALTLAVSNASFLRSVIDLPQNFQLKTAALDSISNLIERIFGDTIARSGVVAIFWAIIGLLVYVMIWMFLNFGGELSSDIAVSKYLHPKHVDIRTPLKEHLSRFMFKFIVLLILIFYINIMVSALFPYIGNLFRTTIRQWPEATAIKDVCIGIALELLTLHVLVILTRVITLRRRVFN